MFKFTSYKFVYNYTRTRAIYACMHMHACTRTFNVYTYTRACAHAYMHMHACTHVHMYVRICAHACMHVSTGTCIHVCTCTYGTHVHVYTYHTWGRGPRGRACMPACMHDRACMHGRTRVCVHACMHVRCRARSRARAL